MRSKLLVVSFAALALFALPFVTRAETNKTISTYDTPGSAQNVVVAGNYAYVADQGYGIIVLDISTPATPAKVGEYLLASARTLDIDGNNLYVGAGTSGLVILSIATPTTPVLQGSYTGLANVGNVASNGSYVYITGYNVSTQFILQVVDVSNPGAPVIAAGASSLAISGAAGLTLSSNYIYVVGDQKLEIINAYPILTLAGTYTDPDGLSSYQGVQVYGSVAYVNDIVTGLHGINISNPAAPTASYNSGGRYGVGITISNGYAFLSANFSGGLAIFDIASSSTPMYLDNYSGPATNFGLTVANNIAYLAAGDAGVQLIDVSKPDLVPPQATLNGNPTSTITPGGKFTDPGVTVTGGTVIAVSGKVDTAKVGAYVLTYTVADHAGNTTIVKRTVYVAPTLSNVTLKRNTLTIKVGTRNVVLKPFPGYYGAVVAKKAILNTTKDPFYLFISTATRSPYLVVYNASGKRISYLPLRTISTGGLQIQLAANPKTSSVYIAIAPKTNVLKVSIYNLNKSGVKLLKTFTTAGGKGTLLMSFLKTYDQEYGLATAILGNTKKPYVWRYGGGTKSWYRDVTFNLNKLIWTKTSIKLR